MIMKLPVFPECSCPIVKLLDGCSDQVLLDLFRSRHEGRYFTAIFCRYSHLVYALVKNLGRSPIQADYLFAQTWRQIYRELADLNLEEVTFGSEHPSLQSWILDQTATRINQAELPTPETINYALSAAPPPLWCYLEETLEHLPAALRLMITLSQTFHWSETRIAAYLEAEGEAISPLDVKVQLQAGYQLLETSLPQDIQEIYLSKISQSVTKTAGSKNHPLDRRA